MDLCDLEYVKDSLRLLGSKGRPVHRHLPGTVAGDQEKVDSIDPMIAEKDRLSRIAIRYPDRPIPVKWIPE